MTIMRISPNIIAWLRNSSPEERAVWLAKGPAEVAELGGFGDNGEFIQKFRPAIRGVLVGEAYDTYAEASTAAEDQLKSLGEQAAKSALHLDEEALGITTTNHTVTTLLDDSTLQIEHILHLGNELISGEDRHLFDNPFTEFLEDLDTDENLRTEMEVRIPWLKKLHVEDDEDEDDKREEKFREAFCDLAWNVGARGFLVQVAHPVMTFYPDSTGASFTWGHYQTQWFYGETLLDAVQQAAKFFETQDDRRREEVQKKSQQPEGTTP